MPEPELVEGTIVDFDPEPKKVGAYGNLKQGVRIEPKGGRAEWYSLLDKEPEVKKFREKLAKGAQIKASFVKEEKEGKTYRNLKQVFSVGAPGNGTAPPVGAKEAPKPEEEQIGIEELERLENEHYTQAISRARKITAKAGLAEPSIPEAERLALTVATYQLLASPKVYLDDRLRSEFKERKKQQKGPK